MESQLTRISYITLGKEVVDTVPADEVCQFVFEMVQTQNIEKLSDVKVTFPNGKVKRVKLILE